MEHLIRASRRVVFGVDTEEDILATISRLKNDTSTVLSDQDRRRILDYPEPDPALPTTAATYRSELLARAAESPASLTDDEVRLAAGRFWPPDATSAGSRSYGRAQRAALRTLGEDGHSDAHGRLEDVRRRACADEAEVRALANVEAEKWARQAAEARERTRRDDEDALARGKPWVRTVHEEQAPYSAHGLDRKSWGFAAYTSPRVEGEARERHTFRSEEVLRQAMGSTGAYGFTLSTHWMLQDLEWPESVPARDGRSHDGGGEEYTPRTTMDNDTLRGLRGDFAAVVKEGKIRNGLEKNSFIVVNSESIQSVLSKSGNLDDMWVWVVDPDWETSGAEAQDGEYNGCLKVRLQQVAHKFYELRHFHSQERSMEELWHAAQKSRNQLLVSIKSKEIGLWQQSRYTGSALLSDN